MCTNDFDENNFPKCNMCGDLMSEFDGWAWYSCPGCGNRVRIIDGEVNWSDDIFSTGKKKFKSDFELADFCSGWEITED